MIKRSKLFAGKKIIVLLLCLCLLCSVDAVLLENAGAAGKVLVSKITMPPVLFVAQNSCAMLSVTILPSNAAQKKLNWASSDSKIACFVNGSVDGKKVGKAVLTAQATDGSKVKACVTVYVYSSKYPVPANVYNATALRVRTDTSTSATVVGHLANGMIKIYGPAMNGFYPVMAKDKDTKKTVYGFCSKDYISLNTANPGWIDYSKKFEELKAIFPNGKYWAGDCSIGTSSSLADLKKSVSSKQLCNHSKGIYHCNHWNGAGGGRQCMGFARMVAYYLTGHDIKAAGSKWVKFYKFDDLRPGDCVQLVNGDHTMIVYTKAKDYITVVECNNDRACGIFWGRKVTKSTIEKRLYCFYGYRP